MCSERQCGIEGVPALSLIISCEVYTVICTNSVLVVIWIESVLDFMSAYLLSEKSV